MNNSFSLASFEELLFCQEVLARASKYWQEVEEQQHTFFQPCCSTSLETRLARRGQSLAEKQGKRTLYATSPLQAGSCCSLTSPNNNFSRKHFSGSCC